MVQDKSQEQFSPVIKYPMTFTLVNQSPYSHAYKVPRVASSPYVTHQTSSSTVLISTSRHTAIHRRIDLLHSSGKNCSWYFLYKWCSSIHILGELFPNESGKSNSRATSGLLYLLALLSMMHTFLVLCLAPLPCTGICSSEDFPGQALQKGKFPFPFLLFCHSCFLSLFLFLLSS